MDDNFRNQGFPRKKFLSFLVIIFVIISIPLTILTASQKELRDSRGRANLATDINTQTKELFSASIDSDKIIISQNRKEQMISLAKSNPDEFLLNALTTDMRNNLPIPAQENVEKFVEINGQLLENEVEESANLENKPGFLILQETDNEGNSKKSYEVYLREDQAPEFSGRVKIKGYLIDNVLIPISIDPSPVLGIASTGNLRIAVLMVNFKTDMSDTTKEFSKENLEQIYFSSPNSVANYLKNTSLGNLTASGDINDVYGWMTLRGYTRKQVCDIYEKEERNKGFIKAINQMAKAEAERRGKIFSEYNVIAYVFPAIPDEPANANSSNCHWNAITKGIPGDPIVAPAHFLNGDYDGLNDVNHGALGSLTATKFYSGILTHEVGHSLGLSHAHGLLCGTKQIDKYENCTLYNYGDRFDLIGGAWDYHSHTNAKNKVMQNWIPTPNLKTVTSTGEYTLYSSSRNRSGQTQVIKIPRSTDGGNYYIEYKSKNSGDGGAPSYVYEGAILRLGDVNLPPIRNERGNIQDEWRIKQTYLIDVNKTDSSGRGGLLNPAFKNGMVFNDLRNQIKIKQISNDGDSVKLHITTAPPPCEQANPSLSVTEPALSGSTGETVRYELTIKNNNSLTCASKNFDISGTLPANWQVQFSQSSFYLASNQSIKFYADITSPLNANYLNNPFSVIITATNRNNTSFLKNREIRYNVEPLTPGITNQLTPTLTPVVTNSITNTPTPTKKPTNTPTPTRKSSSTPTPTPRFTSTPTPTLLPTDTILKFTNIKLHGIGKGGDNTNPNITGNNNPVTENRILNVEIYDSAGNLVANPIGTIIYLRDSGDFIGDVKIDSAIQPGNYLIKVKTDKYLRRQFDGIVSINPGSISQVAGLSLVAGDVNNDGQLSTADYDIIADCYSDLAPAKNCNDSKKFSADLSDDGRVDQDDYSLFLRELSVQSGQ